MKSWSIKIFLFAITFQCLNGYTQNRKLEKDSVAITQIASDFFHWYIATANNSSGECFPSFIQDKNGMTTLDYSKYVKNLVDLSFSDSLIAKEKRSYQSCIDNLAKVKYAEFLNFDLGDVESINCDFNNYYRWTGGQEMFDGYTPTSVNISEKKASVEGFLFPKGYEANNVKGINRSIIVSFIKQDKNGKYRGLNIDLSPRPRKKSPFPAILTICTPIARRSVLSLYL